MLGSGSVWNNPAAASQNRDEKENTANRGNQKAGKREPHAPANKGGNVWHHTTVESSGHAVNGADYADRETADEKPDTEPSHGSSVRSAAGINPISATSSSSSQTASANPISIAGVTRSVWWMRQKRGVNRREFSN